MDRAWRTLVAAWCVFGCVLLSACGDDDASNTLPASTATPTPTRTPLPSVTPPSETGPVITFFGITRADDTLVPADETKRDGLTVYSRTSGSGFRIVIEGKPGPSASPVGSSSYQEDLTSFPDLLVETSHQLGDGSAAVCDTTEGMFGGVPATDPPNFDPNVTNINVVNDLACRFRNGANATQGRSSRGDSCVKLLPGADFDFVNADTTMQFCAFVDLPLSFPSGDTVLTARLRDITGNIGAPAQIVIHIGS